MQYTNENNSITQHLTVILAAILSRTAATPLAQNSLLASSLGLSHITQTFVS